MKKALNNKEESVLWYAFDTYAAVLFKLNNKEELKNAVLKAIVLAKSAGVSDEEYKSTLELLVEIENL